MTLHVVSSEKFSSFDIKTVNSGDTISVRVIPEDASTQIAELSVFVISDGTKVLTHVEKYFSPKEFATITMKQSLTLYVKRSVIAMYPKDYTVDDPRVHSYVSRLSYEGIRFVANNLKAFAEQFHSGRITMKIPKNKFNETKRH